MTGGEIKEAFVIFGFLLFALLLLLYIKEKFLIVIFARFCHNDTCDEIPSLFLEIHIISFPGI